MSWIHLQPWKPISVFRYPFRPLSFSHENVPLTKTYIEFE